MLNAIKGNEAAVQLQRALDITIMLKSGILFSGIGFETLSRNCKKQSFYFAAILFIYILNPWTAIMHKSFA